MNVRLVRGWEYPKFEDTLIEENKKIYPKEVIVGFFVDEDGEILKS